MQFDLDSKNYELLPDDVTYTGKAILTDIFLKGWSTETSYFALKFIIKDTYYTHQEWTINQLKDPEFATNCANNLMKAIRDNCSEDYTKSLLEKYKSIESPVDVCFDLIHQIRKDKLKLEIPIKIHSLNGFRQIDLYPACCQGDAT